MIGTVHGYWLGRTPANATPATEADGALRYGAQVAKATGMIDLDTWPAGARLILRKERPHPGAQLRFSDLDWMRVTAFLTDTPPRSAPENIAGLELRHHQHTRVEGRIRQAKAAGLRDRQRRRSRLRDPSHYRHTKPARDSTS